MKLLIVATETITEIDGVPVRLWKGATEHGVRCLVFVHRIAVHNEYDSSQFHAELHEQMPPGVKVDLRQVL